MRPSKSLILMSFLISLFSFYAKGQYDFTVDITEGCTPLKVKFNFATTATVDSIVTYYWDFGNGDTDNVENPDTVVYDEAKTYNVTLVLEFSGGTTIFNLKPQLITVYSTPQADFTYNTLPGSLYNYVFEQDTEFEGNIADYDFTWDIEGFASQTGPVQEITFPRADTFTVSLTVTGEFGCSTTMTKQIEVLQQVIVPNVFTPGNNSQNDLFIIKSIGDIPLRIKIFSRTGILVYETEGPVITWNGETASGDKLKSGIYFYSLEAINGDPQKIYTKTGFFHMYRK